MSIIKKTRDKKCWWGCGEKGTLEYCWQESKLVQSPTLWKFFKKTKTRTTIWSSTPRLHIYLKETKTIIQKDTSTPTLTVQFSSVAQLCPTLCDPMNHSTPGLPVHHQILEFTQTHVHRGSDAIQPSHPRSSPSPPALNPSQHQSLFQWVNPSHEVAKVLEFQL